MVLSALLGCDHLEPDSPSVWDHVVSISYGRVSHVHAVSSPTLAVDALHNIVHSSLRCMLVAQLRN